MSVSVSVYAAAIISAKVAEVREWKEGTVESNQQELSISWYMIDLPTILDHPIRKKNIRVIFQKNIIHN